LERESAALAVRLRAAGVAPEQRVGVCLRRDSGLLVGLLGVLRAGGCYVPLDPAYPEERVAYMLDDADCLLVLVDASTRERVAALGRPCLTLEEGGDQANDLALPASEVGADHLAYIIYTSGSTGRPKGVAIEHGSAHAFLRWAGQHYAAEEWSGVLAATSVCFDLSVYELFGTLAEGGTLHLVENLFSLPDYPRRDEISLLNTVPSVCAALLALGDLPGGVRTLNLAGEPLRGHLVRQIRGQPQVRRLVNLYGPTEDTTYSTAHELDLHAEALDEPPIGRPLPGTTVEVLDGFEAPLPLGVAGELYLGGIGLARGYFGKPEQTAERFRVDPGSGERRYRTGDRVRMREDGVLEHLGRLDDQVKFNGFRIELGEIASCLASFPGVSEACAMLTEDSAGLRRLVGYLAAPFAPPLQALNEHLGQSLPHYMLPSAFVVLAELPKTLNGKIDRKALPRPQATGAEPQALPSDPLEQALHQAWQAQLGAPPRAGQGFYAAGGDSLRAVHL
ncbi:TPA: amino acid adenylation domain-containing protein, partial [Pseudomonas aeruginosa]|nr:amino acid adenylation domain-containing protein [Pseudomonas aeruginosa]